MGADILIVDDEPAVRQLLAMVVRTMGMTFCEAEDGVDALEKIEADRPRMIILDVMMPRMDGLTLLRKLRSQPLTTKIPVLLFTAFRVPSTDIEDLNMPSSMIMNKGSMSVAAIRVAVRDALNEPQQPAQPVNPVKPPQQDSVPSVQATTNPAPTPAPQPQPQPQPQSRPPARPFSAPNPQRPAQIPPSSFKPLPPKQLDAK